MASQRTAKSVYEALRQSSAFRFSNETAKQQIFAEVWHDAASRLREEYGPTGFVTDGAGLRNGFGFLVEEFAKKSRLFPRNTKAGEHLARLVLGKLQEQRLRNPDILWVRFTGRRAEVSGFAEVKSSPGALIQKSAQVAAQEDHFRRVVAEIAADKEHGAALDFFAKRKLVVASPLRKVIIVPWGMAEETSKMLLSGWECAEMEFSYDELVFIAQQIWPEFMPDTRFGEGFLGRFEREFMARLTEFADVRFRNIFGDEIKHFPSRELLLFTLATKQLPLLEHEVRFVAKEMQILGFDLKTPPEYLRLKELTDWEQTFFNKFLLLFEDTSTMRNHILYFLGNLREFAEKLGPWCRKREIRETVQSVGEEYDIVAT